MKIRKAQPITLMKWRKYFYEKEWHLVVLMEKPFTKSDVEKIEKENESLKEWLKENLGKDDYSRFNDYFWAFKNEADAIQFKLRWS